MASWPPSGFGSVERVRDVLRSTFWIVPAVCVIASIALAAGLIALDHGIGDRTGVTFLFPGPPEGARSFLSSIVAAMISFTGLVFSITIVVLQLTSGQFSPRVLRHFLRDRMVRYSLGIFVATFVYAMVVQRAVLGTDNRDGFVPRIAMAMAFIFVLASVGLFIAYLARVSDMIRVATIVAEVGAEARETLRRRFDHQPPNAFARPASAPDRFASLRGMVLAPGPGVIVSVNEQALVRVASEAGCRLILSARIGDFVAYGAPLCEIRGTEDDDAAALPDGDPPRTGVQNGDVKADGLYSAIHAHISLDNERTSEQDLAFSVRELVDIAERALSPAVNDPTTACQCIDQVEDIFRRLAVRPPAATSWSDDTGTLRLIIPQYEFSDYLDFAVGEIWHYGSSAAQVPARLAKMLADLATVALPPYQDNLYKWTKQVSA